MTPLLLAGAGAAAVAATLLARKRSRETAETTSRAVSEGGFFRARLTAYHPLDAKTLAEREMEGRPVDRKDKPLGYLEDALAGKSIDVSVSADPAIFPYGQKISIDEFPGVSFRVVDTGENFMGKTKVYRSTGSEPLDVAVRSRQTKVPTHATARIHRGDHLDRPGKEVATRKFKGQTVTGYAILGGLREPPLVDCVSRGERFARDETPYTEEDREAVARAARSSTKGDPREMQAVAWVCRNRARRLGISPRALLAPEGTYGPRGKDGRDFASTELPPDRNAEIVSRAVLSLPEAEDPTGGAIDFWCPEQQAEVQAIAAGLGDIVPGPDEVREVLGALGLHPILQVGRLELLA